MRRTKEQVRDEIRARYRSQMQARARLRKQLCVFSFAFVICVGIAFALGSVPSDYEVPPAISHESTEQISAEHSSKGEEISLQEGSQSSEASVDKPQTEESPDSFPNVGPDEVTTDVSSTPPEISQDESSHDENDLMAGIDKLYDKVWFKYDPAQLEPRIEFAIELFQTSLEQKDTNGLLVCPMSAEYALSMAANGAEGETLAELEHAVMQGYTIDDINLHHLGYLAEMEADYYHFAKPTIANAIWFKESCNVSKQYLQNVLSYYNASAYKAPMNEETLTEINDWVSDKTGGKIPALYEQLPENAAAVLVNTLLFDVPWETKPTLSDGVFTSANGETRNVTMLCSKNDLYLSNDRVEGVCRRYDARYTLLALMPKDGLDVYDFAATLDKNEMLFLMWDASETVTSYIPKFSYQSKLDLAGVLPKLGITHAFDSTEASFGKMTDCPLYLTEIIQQNTFELSEHGTTASSATGIIAEWTSESRSVVFDRPFVYIVMDDFNALPMFMGVLTDIPQ